MNSSAIPMDTPDAAPELARRLGVILAALAAVVAARFLRRPALALLIVPLWRRLTHVARRFIAATRPAGVRRARRARAQVAAAVRLPTGRGWLVRELGYEAVASALQLEALLAEPAMRAALAASPGVGRVLRPLCRMLGLPALQATVLEATTEVTPVPVKPPRPAPSVGARHSTSAEERHSTSVEGRHSPVSHWVSRRAEKPG